MKQVLYLQCTICGKQYHPDDVRYVCPDHGADGVLDVVYDYELIREQIRSTLPLADSSSGGMFAYRPFLPVRPETAVPPQHVGGTPLLRTTRIARQFDLADVWIKDDGRNPTASLKDRASAIAVMKAAELGAEILTTASTGNAAAALAGIAASTGQQTVIFVPASAPPAKITQLMVYGAKVLLVDGTYDDAFELCLQATAEFGWYCRNTGYNPYMAEGKKTVALEIVDQLTAVSAQMPTHIVLSVGDGCIIAGVHKGLRDLDALGLLPTMPKLIGVQAAGSSFIYDAWRLGQNVITKPPIAASTVADSISAGLPRDRLKALTAVQQTGGAFVQVTDEQILSAIPALARSSGVFSEPAGAAMYAGLSQAVAETLIGPGDRVLLLNTGNGLKDIASAQRAVGQPPTIPPTLAAVAEQIKR